MEFKQGAKRFVGSTARLVGQYPLSTIVIGIGVGVAVVAAVNTPAGAIAAAKQGALFIAGVAGTALMTKALADVGGEVGGMIEDVLKTAGQAAKRAAKAMEEAAHTAAQPEIRPAAASAS